MNDAASITDNGASLSAVDVAADIARFASLGLLPTLLKDRSTGGNIIWASDAYENYGEGFTSRDEIACSYVTGERADVIHTRASKAREVQAAFTRTHAEVFTPVWVCRYMIDEADKAWDESHPNATWREYVLSNRLEITCGEAPYLVNRYDAADGKPMPIADRIGILDRKLAHIPKYFKRRSWMTWALNALKSTYGYEYQGDNLLIARLNVLSTVEEYAAEAGHLPFTVDEYAKFAEVVSWNLWQMDGLSDTVPFGEADDDEVEYAPRLPGFEDFFIPTGPTQLTLFEVKSGHGYACIMDWDKNEEVCFHDIKRGGCDMRFDYVIGNPPYQDEAVGENTKYAPQIYNLFMDASYEIGGCVVLVHPGRFLFEAGSTPAKWNRKMLDDKHFRVLMYEPNEKVLFPGTEITGGIAITLHDSSKEFTPIGVFTAFEELNHILHKVIDSTSFESIQPIVISRTAYRFTDKLHEDHPEAASQLSDGHAYDVASNIFDTLPQVFSEALPTDGFEYIRMMGLFDRKRTERFIRRDYIRPVINLDSYKIVMARADGAAGTIGKPVPARIIGTPITVGPNVGTTESFLSLGIFGSQEEADKALKYVKTRFMRTMLGVLKTTQDINPKKFKYVPLQDFSSASDIDWTQPIPDIDRQLYEKYGLDDEEVAFIESHVKEMN